MGGAVAEVAAALERATEAQAIAAQKPPPPPPARAAIDKAVIHAGAAAEAAVKKEAEAAGGDALARLTWVLQRYRAELRKPSPTDRTDVVAACAPPQGQW